MVPLLEPNERPVGRLGDISQLVTAPLTVAVFGVWLLVIAAKQILALVEQQRESE